MKKNLFIIAIAMTVANNLSAYSYFVDNTTIYPVQLTLFYSPSSSCQSKVKAINVPKSTVDLKIEDTMCCIEKIQALRTDAKAPTTVGPTESYPSKSCGTKTLIIYANPNGTVSVIDESAQ